MIHKNIVYVPLFYSKFFKWCISFCKTLLSQLTAHQTAPLVVMSNKGGDTFRESTQNIHRFAQFSSIQLFKNQTNKQKNSTFTCPIIISVLLIRPSPGIFSDSSRFFKSWVWLMVFLTVLYILVHFQVNNFCFLCLLKVLWVSPR